MAEKVNIEECFEKFHDTFSPKIVGELNGQHVMLVRCEGDKVPWHTHDNEDEMFFVLDGTLDILEETGPSPCAPANSTSFQGASSIVLSHAATSSSCCSSLRDLAYRKSEVGDHERSL